MLVIGVRSSWLTVGHEVGLDPLELAEPVDRRPLVLEGGDQGPVRGLALGDVVGDAEVAGRARRGRRGPR